MTPVELRHQGGKPKWVVYGARDSKQGGRSGVHHECFSYDVAMAWLMERVLDYGAANVHAVIVCLALGRDHAPEREIVARVGGGKAWWE